MHLPLAPKQSEFLINGTARWNLAHGPVSSGKTVGSLFAFMTAVDQCPDSQIWMLGHTTSTIYDNAIRLILEPKAPGLPDPLGIFRPFCAWKKGDRELIYRNKTISTTGAKDSGAVGAIQGKTMSLVYCDEMTLFPEYIIDMIDTRLRNPHSKGFASMNPSHPGHKLKKWIDKASAGNPDYYALQFMLHDNPYLDESYKERIKNSLSGIFYKRNYLGFWCLAEGAIFDFFDRSIHVCSKPPRAAEYWIAGIDDGTSNNFACLLIGISTGMANQTKEMRWVEKEFVWHSKDKGRGLTMLEKAEYLKEFLGDYSLRGIYVDPSAAALKLELRKAGLQVMDADNDVDNGIAFMTSEMFAGRLMICSECKDTIREVESYVWDTKASEKGEDAPYKKDDHCFAGETLIITDSGLIKIKDIQTFHKVLTREGYKKVIKKHCKWGYLNEYCIHGFKLTCTSDHRIYTLNREWIEIEDLIQSDILIISKSLKIWESQKLIRSYGVEKNIDVIQNLLITMTDDIITEQDTIFIEISGNSIMDQYQLDTIYITKTEIPSIIVYPISNASQKTCISNCIGMIFDQIILQTNVEMLQKNGINQKREDNGIANMQNVAVSERDLIQLWDAYNVEKNIRLSTRFERNFVQITVERNGEERFMLTMSLQTANYVLLNLQKINIQNQDFAPNPVQRNYIGKTRKRVYDLSVSDCHEYFANGILVHNCIDAMRYAAYTHKITTYKPYVHNISEYQKGRFNIGRSNF